MEGVETVDVSWLHHSQKGHLSRTKSVTATTTNSDDRASPDKELAAAQSKSNLRSRSSSNPTLSPTSEDAQQQPDGLKDAVKSEMKPALKPQPKPQQSRPKPAEKVVEQKPPSLPSPEPQKTAPKPIAGRRNSWISNLSSKFSTGTTPPSQSSLKGTPASPKATSPLDINKSFSASFSPKDREDGKDEPHTSTSPKSPSFLHNALRKLSSNTGGMPKSNGGLCPRRTLNLDQDRERCKISDLHQGKLHRVAFCVDVEIAGLSYLDADENAPPVNQLLQPRVQSHQTAKKATYVKEKRKEDGGALKNSEAAVIKKESVINPAQPLTPAPATALDATSASAQSSSPPTETTTDEPNNKPNVEIKEPTRKQEKKKRSEEERRERKERKRRQAVANGSIPLQLEAHDDEDVPIPAETTTTSRTKAQGQPTTDPVRIYRRCCQLRETPVLKRVVDEISSPSSTLAESPGTVAALDLSNFPMTSQDVATLSDWLAVVPVRKLILENCSLNDESVRAILSSLLSTKTVEQMRSRRRRARRSEKLIIMKDERWGVVEKLSLKDNPKIGREGWRCIGLFINLSKSLKAIDLSGVPFPKPRAVMDPSLNQAQALCPLDVCDTFADALAQRFSGDRLEELLMSECKLSIPQVKRICEAATKLGLRRLGFANNDMTRAGLVHVVEYLKAGECEGLDLGGNPIKDDLDLFVDAIEPEQPLYALSLADCSLNPAVMCPLLQALTRLHNLRFIDFSHNPELFSAQPSALGPFRRFLPKMPSLKRIHLVDVDLSPDHVISLAEILPECPSLCHINILENPQVVSLASATEAAAQEEACAVYASMMTAVRVSRTIIAMDIDVPTAENNEVVKALGSQILAYTLRNLEGVPIAEEFPESIGATAGKYVPIPEILQHIVGYSNGIDETFDEDDEAAPDEDYVIGGTGVVKALGVCLGNLDQAGGDLGDASAPPSGANTPRRRKSRVTTKRPRDMSKNLLESARNIRTRIHSALVREDRAGNDANYRRLQFLDFTLHKMIQRFEDEYPETRLVAKAASSGTAPDSNSLHSTDDIPSQTAPTGNLSGDIAENEHAVDDEDADHFGFHLSRTSSMTSLHARAMTSEEGQVHRLGQNLRRDFLNPPVGQNDFDDGESHLIALRERLEQLQEEQSRSLFDGANDDTFKLLGNTVDELWAAQRQDAEGFERFKQSQIAAQINSGLRHPSSIPEGKNDANGTCLEKK
ncbi:hypothetical protein N7495_002505 [Penicillium taxi]|uniref:uncharacterized protein n=1 Tax=Penicillium taxi TaxID=168475 RepID=UPI00254518A7|nr:uncharacterized protein N7495_002505 [Penicillium taxi]KAJ5901977.1 hypothetical protein N7495_002505 [Penicillium taxi]